MKELVSKVEFNRDLEVRNFWLPGFFNCKNFLTSISQVVARKEGVAIDSLEVQFRILSRTERKLPTKRAEFLNYFYIYGLFLYGATWDFQSNTICELTNSDDIGNDLPTILISIRALVDAAELAKLQKLEGSGRQVKRLESRMSVVSKNIIVKPQKT